MTNAVNQWKQAGRVFIWRYPPERRRDGWHFTAEDAACDSLIELIEAMRASQNPCRRTVALSQPSSVIWGVPNFREPRKETLGPLVVSYDPKFPDLLVREEADKLLLCVGNERASDLLMGLKDIRRGEGDYALSPNKNGEAHALWLWWMPWSGSR